MKLLDIKIFFLIILCNQLLYSQTEFEISVSKILLGTTIEAKSIDTDINKSKRSLYLAFKEIERIDSTYKTEGEGSIVAKINLNAGILPVKLSIEAFNLLQRAKQYNVKYDRLFDVTIGPLTELWGFSSDEPVNIPGLKEIKILLPLIDSKKIILNPTDTSVFLKEKMMRIDLGGIAKGYALDNAAQIMRKNGIKNFILNAGGDVICSGKNSSGNDWVIGVRHPRSANGLIAKLMISNISVSTSGDYERFIIQDNIRYHHILYPQTGLPGLLCQSVTVLSNNSEEGTVLAKYIFLMGYENFKKLPIESQTEYIIITSDGQLFYRISPERKNIIELMN